MQAITDLTSSSALCCRAKATWWVLCRESAWSRDWKLWRKEYVCHFGSSPCIGTISPSPKRLCLCALTSMACWRRSCSLCSCSASDRQLEFSMQDDSMTSPSEIQPSTWVTATQTDRCSVVFLLVCVCVCERERDRGEVPVWPGFAGVSAAGSVPTVCVCDLQSAAAPSVCPVGGAAAPPLAKTAPPLPLTVRYLTRTQTTLDLRLRTPASRSSDRQTIVFYFSPLSVCVSAWMPLRVYFYGKFNTLVSMGTSCVLQRAVSMTTLFPLPPLSSLPLFPLISSVCSWTGQTEHRNADGFSSVSFSSPWFCSAVFYSILT